MRLFILSIITGFLGFSMGASIGVSDLFAYAFGLIGFSLPYAVTLDRIYHILLADENHNAPKEQSEDMVYDVSEVTINKCPACLTEIPELEHRCPSCGLELIDE